ncbi:type VI secretion system tip protein VgrG, partial [Pseudomonas sp. REP124]|uniref:bacteriophage T4 gp5 trimerisation domain-containing protein n=1 Tax=Pseudomonas sp. REP124 TaxID=2875731 RepID=UPI00398CBB21|nr:type VI secretion system tip protein VgrG [Pseudomonas sp. REP124]
GGGGSNELRIEDKKGQEQIFLHAQRDWDENIERDQKIRVGNERHDTVEQNSYSEFGAEEHRTVHADRKAEARADDHLTVGANQHVRIGTGQLVEAGREIHLKSGMKLVLEAGSEMTLVGGGSFIKIDAGGVTVSGPMIYLNSGGSPGTGTGAAPLLPGPLKEADADKAGDLLMPAQRQALLLGAPRCEVCERAARERALKETAQ